MNDLPENLFRNSVWHFLHTTHGHFAMCERNGCRFHAAVVPLAAVWSPTAGPMQQLQSLLAPGDSVWLVGETYPAIPELILEGTLESFQMVMPEEGSSEPCH
jgi:hypothetical protein